MYDIISKLLYRKTNNFYLVLKKSRRCGYDAIQPMDDDEAAWAYESVCSRFVVLR